MDNALAAMATAQKHIKDSGRIKAPPELSDGSGHLSDAKAVARSQDPTINMRTKTISSGHASHGFVN